MQHLVQDQTHFIYFQMKAWECVSPTWSDSMLAYPYCSQASGTRRGRLCLRLLCNPTPAEGVDHKTVTGPTLELLHRPHICVHYNRLNQHELLPSLRRIWSKMDITGMWWKWLDKNKIYVLLCSFNFVIDACAWQVLECVFPLHRALTTAMIVSNWKICVVWILHKRVVCFI